MSTATADPHRTSAGFDGERGTALRLPPALASRALGSAVAIAIGLHVLLAAFLLVWPQEAPPPEPAVRVVFVDLPPPPAAPLGAPGGAGAAATTSTAPTIETPPEPVTPVTRAPEVVPRPKPRARAKVAPPHEPPRAARAPEVERPPVESAASEPAPGVGSGAAGGRADGVVGGVPGGQVGGLVGGGGNGPVPAAQVAQPPALMRRVAPLYPEDARRREVEGLVLLEAILDREGRVEPEVKILRSIPLLDASAIAAVRQWRFHPARDASGEALRVIVEIPIRFVLQ